MIQENLKLVFSTSCQKASDDSNDIKIIKNKIKKIVIIRFHKIVSVQQRKKYTGHVHSPIFPLRPGGEIESVPSKMIGIIVSCLTQPKSCVPKNSTSAYPSGISDRLFAAADGCGKQEAISGV